jgi:hypothetical protein
MAYNPGKTAPANPNTGKPVSAYVNIYIRTKSGKDRKFSGIPLWADDAFHANIMAGLANNPDFLDGKISVVYTPVAPKSSDDDAV